MKKLLIAMLALITALSVSLAACDKKKDDDDTTVDDDPDDEFVVRDDDPDDETTLSEGDGTTKVPSGTWAEKNDTVYVLTDCNIRSAASKSSDTVGTATMGNSLQRVKTNGTWDEISYNGATAYILSDLVTTSQQRATFVDKSAENQYLHIKDDVTLNLRSSPLYPENSTLYNNLKGSIKSSHTASNTLKLLAISQDNAWAKVSFVGTDVNNTTFTGSEILYVRTSYLVEYSTNGDAQLPG